MISVLIFLILVDLASSQSCTRDWQCKSLACSSDVGGFCYPKPRALHDVCFKEIHCQEIDTWSTCLDKLCQCIPNEYFLSDDGKCKRFFMTNVLLVIVYTFGGIAVIIIIVAIILRLVHRHRQQRVASVQPLYPITTPYSAMGAFPHPITDSIDVQAYDPPPQYSAPPTYSQSQGIPKTPTD